MSTVSRLLAIPAIALSLCLATPGAVMADGHAALDGAISVADVPKPKQTQAGLYIDAAQAAKVVAARDDVILIDVRSPEETMFVGYASAADANIPFKLVAADHGFNAKKNAYKMQDNLGFAPAAKAFIEAQDPAAVIVMCRSGGRSAGAINALVKAGVDVPLYNMIDGFEGDKNEAGRREVNGWKQAGADWTYKVRGDLLVTSD